MDHADMVDRSAKELLDKSLKRRSELLSELEALETFIAAYRRVFGIADDAPLTVEEQPDLYIGSSPRAHHQARVAEMIVAARRTILAEGRPMKRGELVKRLEAQGFEIIGRDKNKVFGTNLWRSERFITVEGKGYWPNDIPLPSESR